MPLASSDYQQFAHDMLNIVGRLQSATELAQIRDPDLLTMMNTDIKTLTRSIKLFANVGWCESHATIEAPTRADVSTLVFEIATAHRPENCLIAIDENVHLQTQPALLRAVIEELLHNMQAHSNPLEPAKIMLQKTSKGYQLQCINSAAEALPPTPENLYTKSHKSKGLGIGLPMVRRAAGLLGAGFDFKVDGQTVTVTLLF